MAGSKANTKFNLESTGGADKTTTTNGAEVRTAEQRAAEAEQLEHIGSVGYVPDAAYGPAQIQVLEGLEAVRKRPSMYIGGTDANGLNHLFVEVSDNAVDEAMAGHCDHIDVILHPDGSVSVKDNGRGIPVGLNEQYNMSGVELALTKLHAGDFFHHDWFVNPWSGFAVITGLVVWGAIPFVAITVFAGLSQVPGEVIEAARSDGARSWNVFREVTFPLLKPIFVILASLSIIWDFQVFNQIWIMLDQRPSADYYLMSVYSFVESFRLSEYGLGSAIAVVMVLIMFAVTFVYIRQMVKAGEVR